MGSLMLVRSAICMSSATNIELLSRLGFDFLPDHGHVIYDQGMHLITHPYFRMEPDSIITVCLYPIIIVRRNYAMVHVMFHTGSISGKNMRASPATVELLSVFVGKDELD